MQIGVCTSLDKADVARAAGFDFIEENIQNLLQGQLPDDQWQHAQAPCGLPVPTAACLLPGMLKVTGPQADLDPLLAYMQNVTRRARRVGIELFVFGSGAARHVPDGWDRQRAFLQIVEFLTRSAPLAAANGVTIAVEPLNRGETNIINTVPEAMECVRAVHHPAIRCLVDLYHFWVEHESLADLGAAMDSIVHVHLADKDGRLPPGDSGPQAAPLYRQVFALLQETRYQGRLSVEALWKEPLDTAGARVNAFIRRTWDEART